jgi:hypothetical protein
VFLEMLSVTRVVRKFGAGGLRSYIPPNHLTIT